MFRKALALSIWLTQAQPLTVMMRVLLYGFYSVTLFSTRHISFVPLAAAVAIVVIARQARGGDLCRIVVGVTRTKGRTFGHCEVLEWMSEGVVGGEWRMDRLGGCVSWL